MVDIVRNNELPNNNNNFIMEVILMIQDMINACTQENECCQV